MKTFAIAIIVLFISLRGHAQVKDMAVREQSWFAYFNQTRFSGKSGLWVDLHYRLTDDFVKHSSVSITRLAYVYYLSEQIRINAGYAYIHHFSQGSGTPDIPEHRPWQQVQWFAKKEGVALTQWLRLEQRFRRRAEGAALDDGYHFNWRFRCNVALTLPLKGKSVVTGTPFLLFNDELHINAGKSIVNNYFDQNRLFVGLGYQFSPQVNASLGYLYIFQQLPAGNEYASIHAPRLFVSHSVDLRKRQ